VQRVNLLRVTHLSPGAGVAGLLTGLTGAAGGAGGLFVGLADGWGVREAAYQAVGAGLFYAATAGIVFGGTLIILRAYTIQLEAARIERENTLRKLAGFGQEPEPEPEPEPRLPNHNGIYIDVNGYAVKAMNSKHKRKPGAQPAPVYAADAQQQIIGRVAVDQSPDQSGGDVMMFDINRALWQMGQGVKQRNWELAQRFWIGHGNPFSLRQYKALMEFMDKKNYIRWKGKAENQGREWTPQGKAVMRWLQNNKAPLPPLSIQI
jgi:hypothetical protein